MPNIIAITIGDINGVGIDIVIKSWKNKKLNNFILFINYKKIRKYLSLRKINLKLNIVRIEDKKINYDKGKINIYDYKCKTSEENSYKSLKYAYEFCKKNICVGIITLPLRKDLINEKINKNFFSHTEFFKNR